MDYDDNDFQSQNLQLAGEGSNKFPPVLQPYALPKFDFDDSLHGHLRFDSLVETEVFLGIESNEDNQWIEEFSRGSSGIRFSSSAAESCSISRCNNVWSEAASSESVEMLLKSVGQEEVIPVQTNPKESDACDELGCIIKHMEPSLKQDRNASSKVSDFTDLAPPVLSGEVPENFTVFDTDIGREAPQVEETSQTNKGDAIVDGGLGDTSVVTVEAVQDSSSVAGECIDANQKEGNTVGTASLDDRTQLSCALGWQDDRTVSAAQNITPVIDRSDNEDAFDHVKDSADANQEEPHLFSRETPKDNPKPEANADASVPSHLENPLISASVVSMEEAHVIENELNNLEESCLKATEGSEISEGLKIDDQSKANEDELSPMINENSNLHVVEEASVSQSGNENLVSQSVAPLSLTEESKTSKDEVDASSNSNAGGNFSSNVVFSSVEFLSESHLQSPIPSSSPADSTELGEKVVVTGPGDAHGSSQDVPSDEKENIKFPSNSSNMDCEVGESCIIDRELPVGSTEFELPVQKLQSDAGPAKESGNGLPVLPGDSITADAVNNKDVEVPSSHMVGFIHSDKQEEIAVKASVEATLSDMKTTVSESAKGTLSAAGDQTLSMADTRDMETEPHAAVINSVSQKSTMEMEACPSLCGSNVDIDEATILVKEAEEKASLNLSEPTLSNNENVQCIVESQEETNKDSQKENESVLTSGDLSNRQAAEGANECGSSAALDKPENDSPTVIKTSELSLNVTDKRGAYKPESSSPTVIKTTELSQNVSDKKGSTKLPERTLSVSEITGADARKIFSVPYNPKQNEALKDDKSFTFEVTPLKDLPQNDDGEKWQPFSVQTSKQSLVVEGSLSISGSSQLDPKIVQDLSRGSQKIPVGIARNVSKGSTERKTRRGSGKSTGKDSAKKRNTVKETASVGLDRGEKISNISSSPSAISPVAHSSEMRYGIGDPTGVKAFSLATPASSLPDLNSSASPSVGFQQPFTDLQQVQLRAQIFVYGALIQGTAPDEACMISAFGGPEGGRSIWDNAWRSCIERFHGRKSHFSTPETSVHSRSGPKTPDQVVKQGTLQSKAITSPAVQASSMASPILNPMVPLSSPLWSLQTPSGDTLQSSGMPRGPVAEYHRPLSPLHPHQTPPVRNYVGHNPSSWMPQSPFGGPWGASHTTTLDTSGRFPVPLPMTEPSQLRALKEPSAMHSSGSKNVSTGVVAPSGTSAGVITGILPASDSKQVTALSGQLSTEPKPRKRKKTLVPESPIQSTLHTQPQIESTPAAVTANPSTSISVMSPAGFASKDPKEKFVAPVSPMSTELRKGDQNEERGATLSEETLGKVKEARMQAEDAASLAAAAVSHSQEIWNQLDRQKNSGMLPDVETKLASAAVAIAAAAAANVASNAALQAKLMADEAVASGGYSGPSNGMSHSDGMELGQTSPASILKGDDKTNSSSSILFAAREAARKKVEAASAASKRAENLDAIVRAAELAAEAVSQAGKIVTLGDPLLTELVAAGPEGYWKATRVASELAMKAVDVGRENLDNDNVGEGPDSSTSQQKEGPLGKTDSQTQTANYGMATVATELISKENMGLVDGFSAPVGVDGKDAKGKKGRKSVELAKTAGVVVESENGSKSSVTAHNEFEKAAESLKESNIKEGSQVEVFKDGSGFKAAWFSASVLSLQDGKAYVCYTDLALGEGLEKLKEWVPLKGEGDEAPKIRVARPVTAMPFEGTRKRRRAAMGEYSWSVGDRVDAWIQDSWWEGVITEKNKKDESMLTVHFPVQNETSVVRAWHLRPSLVWRDGEWIEWSSSRGSNSSSLGGDTPKEKRPRVRSPIVEAKGKDKESASASAVDSEKPNEPTLLELTADEKLFNIGKSTRNESKPDSLKMTRTGLQKEGSRVIFGVPKPGKKRKFMEVSKHYVADRSSKTKVENESVKLTKYLMPQGSGSKGWKNTSKTELNEKRAAISKPKVPRSGKPQNASRRTIPKKENAKNSAASASDDSTATDNTGKRKESVSHVENASGKHNLMDLQTFSGSGEAAEGPVIFSSLALPSDTLSSKKMSAGNAKPERVSKGKLAPAGAKLGKIEEDKIFNGGSAKSTSDVAEPRRSNRRIQPTSRLLEGLQSSLMVTKIPSVSHDKNQKGRSVSRG